MFRYYHHFRAIVLSLVVGCVVFMLMGGLCQHDHWALPIVNRRSRVQLAFSNHCTAESVVQEGDCVVPPLISFEKRFRVVPRLRLNICAIEKNMSTVLTAIACFLFNETSFREHHRQINKELFHRRLCGFSNEAFSMNHLVQKFNVSEGLSNWLHLAVVRDPIHRFLSAFVDKCVLERTWRRFPARCNRCQTNMTCFVDRQFERMVQFAAGARLNSFDDRHFFPQNWRCDFSAHFRRFHFIRFFPDKAGVQYFFNELFEQLRKMNVTESAVEFIRIQSSQGRTPHSTFDKEEIKVYEKKLIGDKDLVKKLIRMYYYDFVLFGFPMSPVN